MHETADSTELYPVIITTIGPSDLTIISSNKSVPSPSGNRKSRNTKSKESRDNGSYDMAFYGVVDGKVEMTASVIGQGDPGYSSTSKMITESALCLLNDCDDLPGGIYSIASSMGTKLIKRLEKNEVMSFKIES